MLEGAPLVGEEVSSERSGWCKFGGEDQRMHALVALQLKHYNTLLLQPTRNVSFLCLFSKPNYFRILVFSLNETAS